VFALIDTFLDLVETGNFNRTAERLNLTQSSVSARIRALERSVGAILFRRGRMGAELTPAGVRFEDYARAMKLSWNMARQEIGVLDRYDGILRIATQVSLADRLIHEWVSWLRRQLPRTAIHVEADYSARMIADIMFGNLDVGVVYTPQFLPDLAYELLMEEPFQLVATREATVEELDPADYIRVGYSPLFDKTHADLLPHLHRPPVSVGLGSLALRFLREGGAQAAYLPRDIASGLITERGLHLVRDAPEINQPVYVVAQVRQRHRPQVRKAISALKLIAQS
jgi:LysR family transcriptional regulator, flagellar master operon regulator